MRTIAFPLVVTSLLALAACEPSVPDSGAGVIEGRPAPGSTITGEPLVPAARISTEPLPSVNRTQAQSPGFGTSVALPAPTGVHSQSAAENLPPARIFGTETAASSSDIAHETAAALQAARSNSGIAPLEASPSNPAPQLIGNPGISDENDFTAVSARQSIESDAARLERNRQQFEQVAPTALPQRSGESDPNVVRYALSTSHPVGTRVYSRSGINLRARSQRNCALFPSADAAQVEFLRNGGPKRDRKALDPDGDGYACGWDPRPFRLAVGNR